MDLAIIFISLLLLMFFAYRGFSLIFIAPIFAVLAAITSDYTSMPVYSELYMTKAAEYIKSYYPVFLLGAVFAKIMEEGGLAASVAAKIVSVLGKERAILAVLLGCGVLTYGGLSVFVVAFVMYPFAAILFKQADIPKRLLPAILWMGIFTYSMVSLPWHTSNTKYYPSCCIWYNYLGRYRSRATCIDTIFYHSLCLDFLP